MRHIYLTLSTGLLYSVFTVNAQETPPIQCTPTNAATDCVFGPTDGIQRFTVDRMYAAFNIECAGASGGDSPGTKGGSGAVVNQHFSGLGFENTFLVWVGAAGGSVAPGPIGGDGGTGASPGGKGGSGTAFSGGGGGGDTILLSEPEQRTAWHFAGGGGASLNNNGGDAGLPTLAATQSNNRGLVYGQPGGGGSLGGTPNGNNGSDGGKGANGGQFGAGGGGATYGGGGHTDGVSAAGGGAGGNTDYSIDTGVTVTSLGYNSGGDGYCRVTFPPTPSARARARKRSSDPILAARQATADGIRHAAAVQRER